MHPRASVLLAVSCLAVVPAVAGAQAADSRGAAWVTVGIASAGSSEIEARYQPEMLFRTVEASAASQTIATGRHAGWLATVGGQIFVSPRVGLESWMSWDSLSTDATSSPYFTAVRYVSRPPPFNEPVLVDYSQSTPWPAVRVSSARWTTTINGVARWGTRGRLSGTVSGGLAFVRVTATAAPLGYTTFALGGHSTLFPNEYRLSTDTEPITVIGGNVGTSFDVGMTRHAAFTIEVRQVIAPRAHPALHVVSVDRSQAGFEPPGAEEISAQLSASTVSLPTSVLHVSAGLRFRF